MQSNSYNFLGEIYKSFKRFATTEQDKKKEKSCSTLKEKKEKTLLKHQEFLYEYSKKLNTIKEEDLKQRGLLVYWDMGSGKSLSGISVVENSRQYNLDDENEDYKTKETYKRKVILMIPASLFFDPWVKELSSFCKGDCRLQKALEGKIKHMKKLNVSQNTMKKSIIKLMEEFDYHLVFYNVANLKGGWMDRVMNIPTRKNSSSKYTNKISSRDNPFDDAVVIIDEIHNFSNMIANKISSNVNSPFYDLLYNSKNTRVFGLTGTPVINRPFEMAILANIIRGKINNMPHINFETNIDKFNEMFLTQDMSRIKNKKLLSRRLNGLTSYYRNIDTTKLATKVSDDLLIPMSDSQTRGYLKAQKIEEKRKDAIKEFADNDKNIALERIKASNVVYPNYIFDLKSLMEKDLKRNGRNYPVENINSKTNLLVETITPEKENKLFNILNNDSKPLHIDNELSDISKKTYHIIKRINESNGPVVVYSRFVGPYGIGFIAEALKQNGYNDYDKTNDNGTNGSFMSWTGKTKNNKNKDIFNSVENKDGSIIKVFLLTSSGKEGINLFSIRQVHIFEPWWNNKVIEQVIARGIRFCSHDHIDNKDFIDYTIKTEKKTNIKLVNIFRYYSYIDMRYKLQNKKLTPSERTALKPLVIKDMQNSSIDHTIKTIALNKDIISGAVESILKEVAIDCHIHNNKFTEVLCFIDNNNKDYFQSWNVVDDYYEKEEEITSIRKYDSNNESYIIDNNNNVYKNSNKKITVNKDEVKEMLRIGNIEEKTIENDSNKTSSLKVLDNTIIETIGDKDLINKKVLQITEINKNTVVLYKNLNQLKLLVPSYKINDKLYGKISQVKNTTLTDFNSNEELGKISNYDYIILDLNIFRYSDISTIETYINILKQKCKKLIIENGNNLNNDKIIYKTTTINNNIVIEKDDMKNKVLDFLIESIKNIKEVSIIYNDLLINKITSIKDVKRKLKLDGIISEVVSVKSNKKMELNIRKKEDCMKMKVKDIKQTKEFKNLKRKNKHRMKKEQICITLQDEGEMKDEDIDKIIQSNATKTNKEKICEEFNKNLNEALKEKRTVMINPKTGKKIKINKGVFNKLKKECS
jgi:hypothetical protein